MKLLSLLFTANFWLLSALAISVSPAARKPGSLGTTTTIPSTVATGDSIAKFVSSEYGLDGPKLSSVNSTSFEWWYFDAISADLTTSIVVVFYAALSSGFLFLDKTTDVTFVSIKVSFPNGTSSDFDIAASEATITTLQDSSSGCFEGTGSSWIGAADLSSYIVTIDSPSNGIVGTFSLKSLAPAHYPCGPAEAGQNMEVGPNIGWSNAIPDAEGEIDFTIDGSKLSFTGVAYHDQVFLPNPTPRLPLLISLCRTGASSHS